MREPSISHPTSLPTATTRHPALTSQPTGVDRPPLHALINGVSGTDGIYTYGASGGFPTSSFNATNYWVDVLYAAQPYTISGTISGPGGAGATVTLGGTSQATVTADASGNFTFANVYGGNYSVTPSQTGYIFIPGKPERFDLTEQRHRGEL